MTEKDKNLPQETFIVGIGSSAGGLEALQSLIKGMPEHANRASFIVAQHLSPQHKSMLVELLNKNSDMQVLEAIDGTKPEQGKIYITPPNKDVTFENGRIALSKPVNDSGPKPSVDKFFKSLAEDTHEHAIGIILSGTGTDGASGIRAIRAAGGITLVQVANSAKYDGMPQSAIDTDCVDAVMKPEDMGNYIAKVIKAGQKKSVPKTGFKADLETVLNTVNARTGLSFHGYKTSTLKRRLERRMVANGITNLKDYIALLNDNKDEPLQLAQDFLISVTDFFRDKEAFQSIKSIIKDIIKNKETNEPIRVWSVGCATGEETYSLGILCAEALGGLEKLHRTPIQIFGTDIDANALNVAREGTYPKASVSKIPKNYLRDYFICHENHCEVSKQLKDIILFSKHNILENPPFSKIDLIVCRNLLIYFSAPLQEKAFKIFHYASAKKGYLFLGKSESIGHADALFKKKYDKENIFVKKPVSLATPTDLMTGHHTSAPISKTKSDTSHKVETEGNSDLTKSLIESLAPNSVLINKDMEILHVYGDVSNFLKISSGRPSTNLNNVILPTLKQELRAYVYKVLRENTRMQMTPKTLEMNGEHVEALITFHSLSLPYEDNLVLVSFEHRKLLKSETKEKQGKQNTETENRKVVALEQELQATQEHLQTVIEELETSNEELQSLNEELQSSNEELQSTNEELETSNEELQSTNEELTTVNDELSQKKQEVESSYNELLNIKNSINFPLLRLNQDMQIIKSNMAAKETFGLSSETGLSLISHLPEDIDPAEILKGCRKILKGEETQDLKLQYKNRHYWLKFQPYRDAKQDITGIILTFIDETERIKSEAKLYDSQQRYKALASTSDISIYIKDLDGCYLTANEAMQNLLDRDEEDIVGKKDASLFGKKNSMALRKNDLKVQKEKASLSFEETYVLNGKEEVFLSIKSPLFDQNGKVYATSGISVNITDRKDYLEQLRLYKSVIENANDIILITEAAPINSPGPKIKYANKAFERLTGYETKDVIGKTPRILQGPKTDKKTLKAFKKSLRDKEPFSCELLNYGKNGDEYILEINNMPIKGQDGKTKYFAAIQRDITDRFNYEKKLEFSNKEIKKAHRIKSDFLANMSHEIRTPMNAICGIADILENFEVEEKKRKNLIYKLNASTGQLKELIDDILDFSKL